MSVSSLETSPVPLDLPAKYQKIVTEYAKIRAQFGVLKKAVVDEQTNSAEMKETLRIKDQNLRKAEQEIDSLNFRNQQLTKRVTILQDELDAVQNPGKKGKGKGPTREVSNSILAEELGNKISENAQLSSMLQEQSEKFESEKFRLVQKQEVLEHELQKCKEMLQDVEKTKLTKLRNENRQLMEKLNAKDEALKKLFDDNNSTKGKSHKQGMRIDNDKWNDKYSKLLQCLSVDELLRAMITFFHVLQVKYKNYIDASLGSRFSDCILKAASSLEAIINSYSVHCVQGLCDSNSPSGFEYFSSTVNSFTITLDELNLYLISGKDEELGQILQEIVSSLKDHWVQFHSATKSCLSSVRTTSDSEECAGNLADVFRSLRNTCDYSSSQLSDKFNGTEREMESGKELILTLTKVGVHSSGIYKKLMENKLLLKEMIEHRPEKRRAEEVFPAEGEESRPNWKEKYDAMNEIHLKKIKELEEQLSCLSRAVTPPSVHSGTNIVSPADGNSNGTENSSDVFGVMTGTMSVPAGAENEESELTKYFNERANSLVADRQLAESKVTALKSECAVLQKRLEHSIDCRHELEASIKQMQGTVDRLQEELTTTSTNYEVQLSSLSEHMANMNDKLTAQQEEIEFLNYQLSEKGVKKGKSK